MELLPCSYRTAAHGSGANHLTPLSAANVGANSIKQMKSDVQSNGSLLPTTSSELSEILSILQYKPATTKHPRKRDMMS
jgi:hypothetical protein